jgi:hypothetical protein
VKVHRRIAISRSRDNKLGRSPQPNSQRSRHKTASARPDSRVLQRHQLHHDASAFAERPGSVHYSHLCRHHRPGNCRGRGESGPSARITAELHRQWQLRARRTDQIRRAPGRPRRPLCGSRSLRERKPLSPAHPQSRPATTDLGPDTRPKSRRQLLPLCRLGRQAGTRISVRVSRNTLRLQFLRHSPAGHKRQSTHAARRQGPRRRLTRENGRRRSFSRPSCDARDHRMHVGSARANVFPPRRNSFVA